MGLKNLKEERDVFDARFWRCYRMLRLIASRVLDDRERVEKAVENCWHTASRQCPRFEYEGEFRSWLLRMLIDEALLLKQQTPEAGISRGPVPAVFAGENVCETEGNIPTDNRARLSQSFSIVAE